MQDGHIYWKPGRILRWSIIVRIIPYCFGCVAFCVFLIALLSAKDDPIRSQAFYWFCASIVSFLIPNLRRLKLKDVEIELREDLKRVEKKVDELSDTFFNAINRVWKEDSEMPPLIRHRRNEHWDRFQQYIDSLKGKKKFEVQKLNTAYYLEDYGITVAQLKGKLQNLGFYKGIIDDDLSKDLIQSIVDFQKAHNMRHIDGIFGPLTYQQMTEVIDKRTK